MPARYLRHLAVERQPQTHALTVQAATAEAASAVKLAQKPRSASTVTVASVALFKAKLLVFQAATGCAATLRRNVTATKQASTAVHVTVLKLAGLFRRAVLTLVGALVQGSSPMVTNVTVAPAVYVQVTAGPL